MIKETTRRIRRHRRCLFGQRLVIGGVIDRFYAGADEWRFNEEDPHPRQGGNPQSPRRSRRSSAATGSGGEISRRRRDWGLEAQGGLAGFSVSNSRS